MANSQIYEEATEWLIRHREGGLKGVAKPAFDRWLRSSPQHVQAYLEMSATWEETSGLDPIPGEAIDELLARARAHDPVVPLVGASSVHKGLPGTLVRALMGGRLAIAASVLIALAGVFAWLQLQRGSYGTEVGEQRSIVLADGSRVELNSDSRLRVRFTAHSRGIELLSGQALFRVAKDPSRPFVVRSASNEVRALGTQFDVYRKKISTVVTVLEGSVAVSSPSLPALFSTLVAGQQLVATPQAMSPPRPVSVAIATAWTERKLVFESTPLHQVAEEFNRYSAQKIVVEDSELRDFHVSGVFSSADPSFLLKFLHAQPEIALSETAEDIRISKK